MKTIVLTCFLLTSMLLPAQLSVHLGARLVGPATLSVVPYDGDEMMSSGPSIPFGAELGYRFHDRFELRSFYYGRNLEQGRLLSAMYVHSKMRLYGLRPHFNIYTNKKGFNFDIAACFEQVEERTNWHDESWGLFSASDSAGGSDQLLSNRIGLSPTMRFVVPRYRLSFEASLSAYYIFDRSFQRKVHYNSFYPDTYTDAEGRIREPKLELRISAGYSFW